MDETPVLPPEEYIEQAYFFRAFRERIADGQPAQLILRHIADELLSTTRLPHAVRFMLDELRQTGQLNQAASRIPHYFTPLQAHILSKAEDDNTRLTIEQGLLILEREAEFRSDEPTAPGLFIYHLESMSRNRLGYTTGLKSMEGDGFYGPRWKKYIRLVRAQLGVRDFAELIFARSEYYVQRRRAYEPEYRAPFDVLFSEKEGRIAAANRGKDPMFLFATLQRQLGYPEVPRPPKRDDKEDRYEELEQRLRNLESRVGLLDAEMGGKFDLSKFYVKEDESSTGNA